MAVRDLDAWLMGGAENDEGESGGSLGCEEALPNSAIKGVVSQ